MEGTETDLAVPLQSELDSIYEKFHDEVGHPGINTTLHSVQQRYTWAGVSQDVKEYVSLIIRYTFLGSTWFGHGRTTYHLQ